MCQPLRMRSVERAQNNGDSVQLPRHGAGTAEWCRQPDIVPSTSKTDSLRRYSVFYRQTTALTRLRDEEGNTILRWRKREGGE